MAKLGVHFLCIALLISSLFNIVQGEGVARHLYEAHGWTLWASFGLLFPLGIITAKYCQKSLKSSWYFLHWVIQTLGLLSATVGLAIGYAKFDAAYDSTHAKLGQALGILIWVQPIIAVLRPKKNEKNVLRKPWYFIHWLLGTVAVILGWLNIYKGLDIYTADWSNADTMKVFYISFSIQISVIGFVYLFADRWKHMMEQ